MENLIMKLSVYMIIVLIGPFLYNLHRKLNKRFVPYRNTPILTRKNGKQITSIRLLRILARKNSVAFKCSPSTDPHEGPALYNTRDKKVWIESGLRFNKSIAGIGSLFHEFGHVAIHKTHFSKILVVTNVLYNKYSGTGFLKKILLFSTIFGGFYRGARTVWYIPLMITTIILLIKLLEEFCTSCTALISLRKVFVMDTVLLKEVIYFYLWAFLSYVIGAYQTVQIPFLLVIFYW